MTHLSDPCDHRSPLSAACRPAAQAKQIVVDGRTLFVRGVTYGTFRPGPDGTPFPPEAVVARDFAAMARHGINTVRTYTTPPDWLLDLAHQHGLYVMAGVAWSQHVAFLDQPDLPEKIEAAVRAGVRACAGHPALLCHVVGNEIPTSIVRWHGPHKIERFLERLVRAAREEDPDGLVTYANYPSSEYLSLPFLDLYAMNLFLERRDDFEAYVARLQHRAGERPLLISESGLDAGSHGEEAQADAVDWQVRAAFEGGCAGIVLFAWTDEWYRDGRDVAEWSFGLTDAARRARPALAAASRAFAEMPFAPDHGCEHPRVSVIVCTHNGSRTIRACLKGISRLEYPDVETIVVDDGSTDGAGAIAEGLGFRVIHTEHRGLSSARNTGLAAATGEIVAYIDDDAFPDRHWLSYLVLTFQQGDYVAVGGPNIPPPGHGLVADAVAVAPGGPAHVLVTDREAEHLPGCNLAIRRAALEAIGGFDMRFRTAGDDVDVCWRLQEVGGRLGFSPSAVVWHHRRDTVRGYWRQQVGYGHAEDLLAAKWPEKYNQIGQATWLGRLYGASPAVSLLPFRSDRVRFGRWGGAAFQSAESRQPTLLDVLPLTAHWYGLLVAILVGSLAAVAWPSLALVGGTLGLAMACLTLVQAARVARRGLLERGAGGAGRQRFLLSASLVMLQPLARLAGRTLRRPALHDAAGWVTPVVRGRQWTSTRWTSLERRLSGVDEQARRSGARVQSGTPRDRWDLQVDGGLLGSARLRTTVEEHGHGVQVIHARIWPSVHPSVTLGSAILLIAALATAFDARWPGTAALVLAALAWAVLGAGQAGKAEAIMLDALRSVTEADTGAGRAEALSPSRDLHGLPSVAAATASLGVVSDGVRAMGDAAVGYRSVGSYGAVLNGSSGGGHTGRSRGGVLHDPSPRHGAAPFSLTQGGVGQAERGTLAQRSAAGSGDLRATSDQARLVDQEGRGSWSTSD